MDEKEQPDERTQGPREEEARERDLRKGHPEIGLPQAGMPIGVVNPLGQESEDSFLEPPLIEPESGEQQS
ncbi:MAG TPA: hypothetical protein VEX38_02720 [Fimbriimonadaceae bacterium]|nr:hypothetical protein [Fimbriimonadaceae bacterium]